MKGEIGLVTVLFLAVGISVPNAFASSFSVEPYFCTAPYEAICTPDPSIELDKIATYNRGVVADSLPYVRQFPTDLAMIARVKYFETRITKDLNVPRVLLDALFERAINSLRKTVEDEPGVPARTKRRMKQMLSRARLLTAWQFVNEAGESEQGDLSFGCGLGLDAGGMFSIPLNAVVLCPGALSLLGMAKDRGEAVVLRTIAHELGHAIDSDALPEAYARMRQCIANQNPVGSAFADKLDELDEERSHALFNENIADYWGMTAFARLLETRVPEGLREWSLAKAFRPYCLESGRFHPDGNFRIQTNLAKNPAIRRAMGCLSPPPPSPALCTPQGTLARYGIRSAP